MPNQRAPGQKQVIVTMKEEFLSLVDGNLERMGFGDRAQFIRTAVLEKMQEAGVEVEKIMATPPSRAGKGGRGKKIVPIQEAKVADDHIPSESAKLPRKKTTYPAGKPHKKTK